MVIFTIAALIFCAVGMLFRKKDLFTMFDHPLTKKYPNISKIFGAAMIFLSLSWFLCVLLILTFDSRIS